jgi:hypothetical protein
MDKGISKRRIVIKILKKFQTVSCKIAEKRRSVRSFELHPIATLQQLYSPPKIIWLKFFMV